MTSPCSEINCKRNKYCLSMNINVWIVVMIAFVKDVLAETSKFTDVIILLIYNLFSLIFLFPWYT